MNAGRTLKSLIEKNGILPYCLSSGEARDGFKQGGFIVQRFRLLAVGIAASLLWPMQAQAQRMNQNTDRRQQGDRMFELPSDKRQARYCLDACIHDPLCRAWTFSVGSDSRATCWFGNVKVQPPRRDDCCVSGNTQ